MSKSSKENSEKTRSEREVLIRILGETFPLSIFLSKRMLVPFATVYIAVIISILSSLLLESTFVKDVFNFQTRGQKIESVISVTEELASDIDNLKKNLSDNGGIAVSVLSDRLSNLEEKEKALSETILLDADKALTAKLLREKQQSLSDQLERLQNDQRDLRNLVTNLLITVIATPIVLLAISYLPRLFNHKD